MATYMQKKQRMRRHREPPFVMLHHWLLESPAWRALTTQERAVYIVLARRYNGSNNGRLALSVRNAACECRISKDTAMRAFKRLTEIGFIEPKILGAFSLKVPHASEWLLTVYRDDVSLQAPKKTFMRWGQNLEHGPKSEPSQYRQPGLSLNRTQ